MTCNQSGELVKEERWTHLLDAARRGDNDALGIVCERLRSWLTKAADRELSGELRQKLAASDLVQQSFLEVQTGLLYFRGAEESEFRAWVASILRRNLLDGVRQYCHTECRDLERETSLEAALLPHPTQATASGIVSRKEEDRALLRAIAELPERDRAIIELRYRERLSHAEIADRLQLSVAAARKAWSRAIERLRSTLTHG